VYRVLHQLIIIYSFIRFTKTYRRSATRISNRRQRPTRQ